MVKKLTAILLMSVTLLLTGCSKADPMGDITVEWKDGVICIGGKETALTEFTGDAAKIENGNGAIGYTFSLDTDCATVTNITPNTQGIEQANMNKTKGMYWYSEYLGTVMTGAKEVAEKTYIVCQCLPGSMSPELVATYMADYIDSIQLVNGYVYVDFGPFTFGSGYDLVKVTNSGASIKGTAKVSKESCGATTPMTITIDEKGNTINLMTKESDKYVYYEYEGYTIQLAKGLDINTYIKFN